MEALNLLAECSLGSASVLVLLPSGRWIPNHSREMAVEIGLKLIVFKIVERLQLHNLSLCLIGGRGGGGRVAILRVRSFSVCLQEINPILIKLFSLV